MSTFIQHNAKAAQASEALRFTRSPEAQWGSTRIFSADYDALREVLIWAACPVVCIGHLDPEGENWHQLCVDKADRALKALEVSDL